MSSNFDYSWLINCPAHDEIKRAIEYLKTLPATKTQVTVCERELRRRKRELAKK